MTAADTIEVYILADSQNSNGDSADGRITIKVQGKGGQRDVVNVHLLPDEPMG